MHTVKKHIFSQSSTDVVFIYHSCLQCDIQTLLCGSITNSCVALPLENVNKAWV